MVLVTDCRPLMLFDSHRQVAYGSVDLTIFDKNTLWLTISNVVVRSTFTQTVRCGGFFWLKLVAISLVSRSKAEVVVSRSETLLVCGWKRWLLTVGSKRASKTFCCWTEERDRPVRSAMRGVLAWLWDWDDNG